MRVLDFIRQPVARSAFTTALSDTSWGFDMFGGRKTASGKTVSPTSSMTLSAYFACIRAVAEDIGKLPWTVKRTQPDGSSQEERTAAIWPILHHWANPEMGSQQFREVMLTWALGWGNGYAEIERDFTGTPIALWPIHPTRIRPWRDPETWKLWYYCSPFDGFKGGLLEPRDVFHVHGIGPDGLQGWSIAELGRQDIGNQLAGQEFEGNIYASGATNRGVLKYPKKLQPGDTTKLRKQWLKTYGSKSEKGAPIILEGGMDFVSVSYNPRDSMFLESMKEGVITIARWFRIPPHKIAALDKATLNNVEHLGIEYVTDTILSWATRLEGEAQRKLFSPAELVAGMTSQIDLDALLRGDFKTRSDATRTLISTGVMSPNDGRKVHGLNPSKQKGANSLWVQGAMKRIDDPAAPSAPPPGSPGDDGSSPDGDLEPQSNPDDSTAPSSPIPADQGGGVPPPGAKQPPSRQDLARAERARRRAELATATKAAAAATRAVFLDAGGRVARRHEKAFARIAKQQHADGDRFRAEISTFLEGERAQLAESFLPAAQTFLATCDALEAPGIDQVGGAAIVEAFVARYCELAAEGAWTRYRQSTPYDVEAEAGQLAAGLLGQFDRVLDQAA